MARKNDIRFDGRAVDVQHASARGEVVRNVGSFTRGSQLVRLRYMMLLEGLRFPVTAALVAFLALSIGLLFFMMEDHEMQLVEMHCYASLWNIVGFNPDHVLDLTLPDDSVLQVAVQDIPSNPAVMLAWSKFWRVVLASILGAIFLTGPLTAWFVTLSQKIGSDILKERQERGATLSEADLLQAEIEKNNKHELGKEIMRRFAPEDQAIKAREWAGYIARMNKAIRAFRRAHTPGAKTSAAETSEQNIPAAQPDFWQAVNSTVLNMLWPQTPKSFPMLTAAMPGEPLDDTPGEVSDGPQPIRYLPTDTAFYAPYTMANIAYPWRLEQSHAMLIGTTGAGKTTQLRNTVTEARLRGQRCVIFDLTGAFVEAFFDPATDYIMNPMDERCPPWTIFNDCENYADFLTAAQALIPDDGGNAEPFWQMAARTLFVEMCIKLVESGETTNGAIAHHLMEADLKDVHARLKDTIASPLTAEAAARMAESIRAVFNTNAQALRFLPDPVAGAEPPFSIRTWMRDAKPGSILFATSRRSDLSLSKKLITLWMDIAVNALMDQPRTMNLNTWFLFDEVHALHRLPAIEHGLQAARNFGGAFVLGLHSFDKLCETYGKEGAVNLASLARTKLILATPDRNTAEECSKWIGSREVRETDEAYSIGATRSRDAATITPRTEVKPLVMADDLMNLPQLHGYVKFPEGFPAARIELTYIHYPEIAPGFMRKTRMTAAPYVPKRGTAEHLAGDSGPEHTSVHNRAATETAQAPAAANENDAPKEAVIDPRAMTTADQQPHPGNQPSVVDYAHTDRGERAPLSGYGAELKVRAETADDSEMRNAAASATAAGQQNGAEPVQPAQQKHEQQISVEIRTGQAATEPDEPKHGHHHGRDHEPLSKELAPVPTPMPMRTRDPDDGMDMGM